MPVRPKDLCVCRPRQQGVCSDPGLRMSLARAGVCAETDTSASRQGLGESNPRSSVALSTCPCRLRL
eukprot:7454577-Pyramimonas_sp.AAC.1